MSSQEKMPHTVYSRSARSQIIRRRSIRAAAMAACAGTSLLCMFDRALATTRTFTAGTSSEWTDPTNWTPAGVPTAGDDAVIPSTSTGTMTITGSNISTGEVIDSSTTAQVLANGGTDATNVTLTLTGNGSAPLINLNTGTTSAVNFTIQGANGSTGTGTLGLVLGASGDFNTTNFGPQLIISANISETGGSRSINKNGIGTLIMSGANSFSGAMELTQNAAIWDYSTNTGDKIASTGSLMFNGGTLILNGNGTTSVNETVSSLNVVAGQSALLLTPTGAALNINIGPINRTNNGGVINFGLGTAGGTPTITTTTVNNPNDGIIGGWATVGTTDWATVSGGTIVALPAASYTDQNNASLWTNEQNITNTTTGAYTGTVGSNLTIGSLKFNNASAGTVTINSGATLTIDSGGIMNTQPNTAGTMSFSGGNLTSGGQDLIVNNASNGIVNISSTITDNNSGSVGLTKTGSASLFLAGNNTFTGQVIINGGSIDINSIGALGTGTGPIIIGGSGSVIGTNVGGTPLATGTLDFQFNNGVLNRPIILGTAGAIRSGGGSGGTMSTLAGTISGGSLFRFGTNGTTVLSGTNTYIGQTEVQAGTLDVSMLAPIGTPSNIGTGTSDPSLILGSGGNTATFAYSGTTDASTGRNIILLAGGSNFQIRNANTVAVNSLNNGSLGAGSFGKYGSGTLEVTGSAANFTSRLNIARGTYQFDDPSGTGTGVASIDVGNANAAALVYNGATPATVSRPLDSQSSTPTSTIQSNISTMTVTGGFNSNATAKQNIILNGAGGVIFNSNIFGTGAGTLTKSGTGTAELMGTDSYINTTINGGTLILDNSAALGTGTVGILNSSSALALASGFTNGVTIPSPDGFPFTNNGTINVNQGKVVVDYNSADRYSTLLAQVATGYNHGAWNGPGINSAAANSASNTQHPTGVAIAEGSDLNQPGYVAYNNSGTYGGQTVDNTSVVMGYTYEGDATMNGTVDSNDFAILAAHYNQKTTATSGWTIGDFNYDGTVNALDFNLLADNYGQTALPSAVPNSSLAAASLGAVVPEPASITGIALLSVMVLRRRRQLV